MAVITKTDISNLALSHLRILTVIQDVDTEQSTEAIAAKLWYDAARREALTDFNFGFSRKRLALSTHGEDPPSDWLYRYQWPSDCILPRHIENPLGTDEPPILFIYEEATDGTLSILTDLDEACLVYTFDQEDLTFAPAHFVSGLSYLHASYIGGTITGKAALAKEALRGYGLKSNTGMSHEGNVTAIGTRGAPDAEWTRARR